MADRLAQFLAKDFPAQSMIVGRGVLPKRGKLVVGGEPKIGKSFLVLNAALDIALGQPLFNAHYDKNKPILPVYGKSRVLLIENEIGEQKLQERMKKLSAERDVELAEFFIQSRDMTLRLDDPEGRDKIEAIIQETKPHVVIFDPLAQFHGQDENSAQFMGRVLREVDLWIDKYGFSVIYVHHTSQPNFIVIEGRKESTRQGAYKLRGSTALFGSVDSVMIVENISSKDAKEPILQLSYTLRHDENLLPMYFRRRLSGLLTYVGEGWTRPHDSAFSHSTNWS